MINHHHCPRCGQARPPGWYEEMNRKRIDRLKASLKSTDKKLGRPRKVDWNKIYSLRDQGMGIRAITRELGCDKSSVQHALRVRKHGSQVN